MSEKEFLIRAIQLVDVDGSPHVPSVIFYPPSGRRVIGYAALARSRPGASVIEDFKVELGNIDPSGKGGRRRMFFTSGGSPKHAGEVTSGGFSPSLDTNIGLGYVRPELAVPGRRLQVDVRGRCIEIETVPLPFYVRPRPS